MTSGANFEPSFYIVTDTNKLACADSEDTNTFPSMEKVARET